MFGLGKVPKIPGTFGSLATVIMLYFSFHTLEISSDIILIGLLSIHFQQLQHISKIKKIKIPKK
jgi:phosphatidylglycerophosphatase A